MFDVICVGSNTVDVFAKTDYSELIKILNPKGESDMLAYPVGAKILVDELDFTSGGGGTNVAAALSNLGRKVAYLGCVGNINQDFVLNDLKRFKIDTTLIVKKEGITGYSIILDSIEHDRTILAYKGVNNDLSFSDINKKKLGNTKWFYFSAMLGKAFDAQEEIAKFASKNGIKIAFNPSSYLAEKGSTYLKQILSRTEILVLNKEEAELLVGKDSVEELAIKINKIGPKYVVITDGKHGAYCYHESYFYFAKAHNIKVVETTGAGDAFASSFLAGIIMGKDVEFALALATTNAESVVTHHGAKTRLLSLTEARAILKKVPVKVTKKKLVLAK